MAESGFGSSRAILLSASSLVASWGVTSALGAVFWWLGARYFSQSDLGVASAAVSAMMLLAVVSSLGLGTLLMGELARRREGRLAMVSTGLITAGSAGLVAGGAFVAVAPLVAANFDPLVESPLTIAVFCIGVAATSVTLVLDQALVGLMRSSVQLHRNTAASVVKLGALVLVIAVLGDSGQDAILTTWVLGITTSLVVVATMLGMPSGVTRRLRPDWSLVAGMRSDAMEHHFFNLALSAPFFILPVLVLALVSAEANASFYVAFIIAGFAYVIPTSLCSVLYAVGAAEPQAVAARLRLTLSVSAATAVVACAVVLAGAGLILSVFGDSYADDAASTLRLLILGTFPVIVRSHFAALTRISKRISGSLTRVWIGTVAQVAAATVGALVAGLEGLAVAWLAVLTVEALTMTPVLVRAAHGDRQDTGRRPAVPPIRVESPPL